MVQKLSKWFSTKSSMFTLITFELWPNQTSTLSLVYLKGVGVHRTSFTPQNRNSETVSKETWMPRKFSDMLLLMSISGHSLHRSCNNSGHFVMMSIFTSVIGTFDLPVYNKNSSHMIMKNKYCKPHGNTIIRQFTLIICFT